MARKRDIPLVDYQCMYCQRIQQFPLEFDFTYGYCYGCGSIAGFKLVWRENYVQRKDRKFTCRKR